VAAPGGGAQAQITPMALSVDVTEEPNSNMEIMNLVSTQFQVWPAARHGTWRASGRAACLTPTRLLPPTARPSPSPQLTARTYAMRATRAPLSLQWRPPGYVLPNGTRPPNQTCIEKLVASITSRLPDMFAGDLVKSYGGMVSARGFGWSWEGMGWEGRVGQAWASEGGAWQPGGGGLGPGGSGLAPTEQCARTRPRCEVPVEV
jgi:hypothetical protein